MLRANQTPVERIVFVPAEDAAEKLRAEMEVRGERCIAVVDARAKLEPGWLDALVSELQRSRDTGAAAFTADSGRAAGDVALCASAGCTLVSLRHYPAHVRIAAAFATLDAALADFLIAGIAAGALTRVLPGATHALPAVAADEAFERTHGMTLIAACGAGAEAVAQRLQSSLRRRPGVVSIVMLSWNAPQFTKLALESIRLHTGGEYEVIIVDNGSQPETVEWLRTLEGVRVIFNAENRGYAGGNNQALEAARGEYVVLLNNDVVVTEGWLDGLLSAFDRIPGLGVSAPRSNRVAGNQLIPDALYGDIAQMHEYARTRSAQFRGQGWLTDRAIGLCLCIDRRVIEEIGGLDERYGAGNFEDDDFCLRVRAAGYRIYVCDDVFIHHFGSQTFAANKVDWSATMRGNWAKFAAKWGYPPAFPEQGYRPAEAIARGFDRQRHYVPLSSGPRALAFAANVRDERDWSDVGAFVRRYLQAFTAADSVRLFIAAPSEADAGALRGRVEKARQRISETAATPPISVLVAHDVLESPALSAERIVPLAQLDERSPSALRRLLK
jgi:GT2 family glycosyltransferase